MSTTDLRYPAESNPPSSSKAQDAPYYSVPLPVPPNDPQNVRPTRCVTGLRFLTTIHGILNIVIFVALICVIISAGVSDDGKAIDNSGKESSAAVSTFHTRNAVLVFSAAGLFFIVLDTILNVSRLVYHFPAICDLAFIIVMLVLAVVYLILGCCAAVWEQKARDTLGVAGVLQHKGAAASAAFFLFVAMVATAIDFGLRLAIKPQQRYNPSSVINKGAYDPHVDPAGTPRF
ncbi:unnamed protein product [Rotaria socialis]|uniref:MARVEL domain-containing protein n=1 Tax=Rotaria socialis TaxID=392032 RepID=A0A820CL83_9BILA|nr:unnamed protein product [Rotaria socialis]CAF3622587.1 unnamed protein product [Rotaria socialis]CAF3637009.1 unnamed protein product [Rotaria socialis]CAF4215518.1 unnamed protein product [Rotaria socialis]CAF4378529.1 unnamed protein product [Rotaria socialis]